MMAISKNRPSSYHVLTELLFKTLENKRELEFKSTQGSFGQHIDQITT
jgi:hypothetical protein